MIAPSGYRFRTVGVPRRDSTRVEGSTTTGRDARRRGTAIWAGRARGCARGANLRPTPRGRGATRCVTPRQACPRPSGFGRNLRSKTRWFTGFCNSHQVSHFATFFIDARAEISVAESRLDIRWASLAPRRPADGAGVGGRRSFLFSLAHSAPGSVSPRGALRRAGSAPFRGVAPPPRRPGRSERVRGLPCRFRQ